MMRVLRAEGCRGLSFDFFSGLFFSQFIILLLFAFLTSLLMLLFHAGVLGL